MSLLTEKEVYLQPLKHTDVLSICLREVTVVLSFTRVILFISFFVVLDL